MIGLFVIHSVGVNIFDHCLKIFDFDQDGEQHDEVCYASIEGRDIVCVNYIEEMFWKSHNVNTFELLLCVTLNKKQDILTDRRVIKYGAATKKNSWLD